MNPPEEDPMVVANLAKEDVVVVPAGATVAETVELLAQAHVSGAPVVEGDHVVGVVTMGDLRRWTAATDSSDLDPVARSRWSGPGSLERLRLADLLGRAPVTAHLDWPLAGPWKRWRRPGCNACLSWTHSATWPGHLT